MHKRAPKRKGVYERKGTYGIDEVLSKVPDMDIGSISSRMKREHTIVFDGVLVSMVSDRYLCFKKSGTTCVTCGLKGTFFALERTRKSGKGNNPHGRYHFNLYGYDADGDEVMLTKDHIVPRSEDGKDHVDNYQTMCKMCNEREGNK